MDCIFTLGNSGSKRWASSPGPAIALSLGEKRLANDVIKVSVAG